MASADAQKVEKATKALKAGIAKGKKAEKAAPNRATGTRHRYQAGNDAAVAALEILTAK